MGACPSTRHRNGPLPARAAEAASASAVSAGPDAAGAETSDPSAPAAPGPAPDTSPEAGALAEVREQPVRARTAATSRAEAGRNTRELLLSGYPAVERTDE